MTEANGQQPMRNISHSWCFYNRSPSIKLNALDGSKYMYKTLGTFLSSPCSKIEKTPDRKDIEHNMEVGNFKISETFHRQLRPSTQIQRAAKIQKRKYNDITESGNLSAENLYLNENIPKKLKASNSLSDISWCSMDDVNSECFQKSRSSNVLKRLPLDSKLCHLPTEDYRRKLRSSHSMVESHNNCEGMEKHSLSSSYLGASNGSGSYTDRSYTSDMEVICEFQCRPIFVILEKLSKHKIEQLTSVGNLKTESVEETRAMDSNKVTEPVDAVYTKDVAAGDKASYFAACKSLDKFLNSSCLQNVEVTELPAGNLADRSQHIRHDLRKGATDAIDVSSSSSKFDKCFGTGRIDSRKDSFRLTDIKNESKKLICAKDHIVEKLKFRQVQDTDSTATPVSSSVHMQLEGKSIEKKLSRVIVDSISTDANIELPLRHNSNALDNHVDDRSVLSAGEDTSSSSESTIDLSDEWTSAECNKIVSDDIDSLQISDPTSCNQDVSKLSHSTRLLKAVGMPDHENLGLPNSFSNGNVDNLLTALDSLPEQKGCCIPIRSKKRGSKTNTRPVHGRKRIGPHRIESKWDSCQRDYSDNSCGDSTNNGNNMSNTNNNRKGFGDSQSDCGSQRARACEKYSFSDAKRSLKEKKDHSIGKNNLCVNRNISSTDIKLSYLGIIDTPSEFVKEKGKESVLYESDSDSDESLLKNCSKFSSSGFSDTTTAEDRMDEDHFKVLDVVEGERDLSDSYVPNFMTHTPHLHCPDDSVNEWRQVADLEEWWLNDRVNFESSLESQTSVLQEDEYHYTNAENERKPLATNAFQWCAMLADQSEWPDIDLCCFHDEVNTDGYHLNAAKGLCVNNNRVATSTQDIVVYSAENGRLQTDRLSETTDSFVAGSKPFNPSVCRMNEKRQISLDAVNELILKTRNKSGFLDSEPDVRVKLDSGVFNAPGAADILCQANAKSESIKSDSLDKFTDLSTASSRDFNSNFNHNASKMYDHNPSFASNGDESRLSMPFLASHASQSYFPSFQMLPNARIHSALPINNIATVNSHNDVNPLDVSNFTTSVQNADKPATELCCRAVLSSVHSPLCTSAACDQTSGSSISKGVSRNHTSAAAAAAAPFSHICPSPVYDHVVISQMQATTCSHNSSQSSFVNMCYASLCQHHSSVCSNSSSCSLLNEDVSFACSLAVSSSVSWPKESSCSNLGFGLQPVLDFPSSRRFLDNANSFSAYEQKPCCPDFTASCSEIASNCLSDSTSQSSEVKFPSSMSSADDKNLDIVNASASFSSPGMSRDSWSSLVCSETTPNSKVCKRALQRNELKTSTCYSNELPASERNFLLSERSDDMIRTQQRTLAEYNLKSSHKTCTGTLKEDPCISNDNGSSSYDDCNSDMCSWLAASMGLYTCICGAAFSDSWSCLQHQFKCSVMMKQ